MATDYANLIPSNISRELIKVATMESAALRLGRKVNLPAGTTSYPVTSAVPTAGFVAARGARKPATSVEWSSKQIVPEEIACVFAVPNDFLEDNTFPIWDEIKPLAAQAIGAALDNAVLWGIGAPASFPTGGVEAAAGTPVAAATPYEAISYAMGIVERSGLLPNGHAVGPAAGPVLRTLKDANGNLVFVPSPGAGAPSELFGLPIARTWSWQTTAELLTGDWTKLILGIRQDIRFEMSTEGVLTDGAGVVTVNAFQDDSTLMRVYMRVGAAIGIPINMDGVATKPFALAEFTPGTPPVGFAVEGPSGSGQSGVVTPGKSTRKPGQRVEKGADTGTP